MIDEVPMEIHPIHAARSRAVRQHAKIIEQATQVIPINIRHPADAQNYLATLQKKLTEKPEAREMEQTLHPLRSRYTAQKHDDDVTVDARVITFHAKREPATYCLVM